MFKRTIAIIALLFTSITPLHAEDLSYLNRTISWSDSSPIHQSPVAYSFSNGSGNPCESGWKTGCDPKTGEIEVVNFIPNCDLPGGTDKRLDCIDSVFANVDGKRVKGKRVTNQNGIDDRYSFSEIPEYGVAKSSAYEIYTFEGLSHSKGNLYMVYPWSSKWISKGVKGDPTYVFLIAPAYQDPMWNCALLHTANDLCWLTGSFLKNVEFTLDVRFGDVPSGWFSGRITDPSIRISNAIDGRTLVSFTGVSQAVPSINKNYFYIDEAQRDEWTKLSKNWPWLSWDVLSQSGMRYSSGIPYPSDAITQYEEIVSRVSTFNNADELKNIWRVDSKPGVNWSSGKSECIKSGLTGVVSSNSMTYANSIPSWDAASNSLVYSMASPHTALGKEFVGRYDLLISEQVGKCLWSLKSLTPSAEISVTGANGEKKVITATSKIVDGFYKFTAAGFTFSSNKISVKMLSDGSNPINTSQSEVMPSPAPLVAPTPIVTQSPAPVAVKKISITCVKGKVQKKVTAVNPKCPTGYKKK